MFNVTIASHGYKAVVPDISSGGEWVPRKALSLIPTMVQEIHQGQEHMHGCAPFLCSCAKCPRVYNLRQTCIVVQTMPSLGSSSTNTDTALQSALDSSAQMFWSAQPTPDMRCCSGTVHLKLTLALVADSRQSNPRPSLGSSGTNMGTALQSALDSSAQMHWSAQPTPDMHCCSGTVHLKLTLALACVLQSNLISESGPRITVAPAQLLQFCLSLQPFQISKSEQPRPEVHRCSGTVHPKATGALARALLA